MKNILVYMLAFLAIIASLALDVRGQTDYPLPEKLPIGDIQTVRDWTVTNSLWRTSVSVGIMYQDSFDTNNWGGNFPISRPKQFASYGDYVSYIQGEAMGWINLFKTEAGPESETYLSSIYSIILNGEEYWPLVIHSDLGPIGLITSNTFLNLPQKVSGVFVPVKNLEFFNLRCGNLDYNSYDAFWYTWDHGASDLLFGGTNDYCVITNKIVSSTDVIYAIIIRDRFAFATNRVRMMAVAEGVTNIYTQHGDSIFSPTRIMINTNSIDVTFPRGADLTVESSMNGINWITTATLPWSADTNFISFPVSVDLSTEKKFYRAYVR
jgi:hypothetical protein